MRDRLVQILRFEQSNLAQEGREWEVQGRIISYLLHLQYSETWCKYEKISSPDFLANILITIIDA